jgi:hypothetical protein
MQDDDESWLDALAGHGKDPAKSATAEGQALRQVLLARATELQSMPTEHQSIAERDPAREAELIARARTAGILPDTVVPARVRSAGQWYARWPVQLAAASIVCMAVGVQLHSRLNAPTETLRSAGTGIVRISAADPVQLKSDLIRELRAAGVQATGYESFGRQGIDADLPAPLPAEVREVLDRHGLPAPRDNILQVEIDRAGSP